MTTKVNKAIILTAGFGVRMLPATKYLPKAMLTVFDKPAIEYVVDEALSVGIDDICVVIGVTDCVKKHFSANVLLNEKLQKNDKDDYFRLANKYDKVKFTFVKQPFPYGSGDALLKAKKFAKNSCFVLLNCDDLFDGVVCPTSRLIDAFDKGQKSVVAVKKVSDTEGVNYGIVCGTELGKEVLIKSIEEKPLQSSLKKSDNLAMVGRYVLTPKIFDILSSTPFAKNGELQLTDALKTLAKKNLLLAREVEAMRFDVGSKEGYFEAFVHFAQKSTKH